MSNMLYSGTKNIIEALNDQFGGQFRRSNRASFTMRQNYNGTDGFPRSQRDVFDDFADLAYDSFVDLLDDAQFEVGYYQIFYDNSEGANPFTTDTGIGLGNNYYLLPSGCVVTGATAETDLRAVTEMRLFWYAIDSNENKYIAIYDGKWYYGSLTVPHAGNNSDYVDSQTKALLIKKDGYFEYSGNLPLGTTDNLLFSHIVSDGDGEFNFIGFELEGSAENVPTTFEAVTFETE